jgi:hypothetical protein
MAMSTRREFIVQMSVGSAALLVAGQSYSAGSLVVETEPQPTSLGYKAVASKADKVKFPKYADGQQCSNCVLYQGKPGEPSGACPLFPDKQVLAGAWCSLYTKKPS